MPVAPPGRSPARTEALRRGARRRPPSPPDWRRAPALTEALRRGARRRPPSPPDLRRAPALTEARRRGARRRPPSPPDLRRAPALTEALRRGARRRPPSPPDLRRAPALTEALSWGARRPRHLHLTGGVHPLSPRPSARERVDPHDLHLLLGAAMPGDQTDARGRHPGPGGDQPDHGGVGSAVDRWLGDPQAQLPAVPV